MKAIGKSMREVSEWDQLRTFFDRRLIKALGHPVREHILAVLNEKTASATEIGEELGADVSSFYHHIEELQKLGCIECVETKPRRGASEHFFRAKQTVYLDDDAWQKLPASIRLDLASSFMQQMFNEAASAVKNGTLSRDADEHVSRMPGYFDERGWKETTALLEKTLERLMEIQKASSARLASGAGSARTATISLLAFETLRDQSAGASPTPQRLGRKPHPTSTP
jgi:predicted ArsR family transcriptional regulator